LNRLLIGHDNVGLRAGWFLDSVQVKVPVHGKEYMFPAHRWLCKDEADGKTEIEIYPSEITDIEKWINYEVAVHTGDVTGAGTDAKVFIQIYGELGKTEQIRLRSRSDNFVRGATEMFKIEALNVGKLVKLRIGHDGSGLGPGWFLDSVIINRLNVRTVEDDRKKKKKKRKAEGLVDGLQEEIMETYTFNCQRWLARDEGDRELVVELLPEENDDLEDSLLEDIFLIKAIDLAVLRKLRIRHDNAGGNAAWFLDRVEIVDEKNDTTYFFPCERWLAVDEDDGQIARELVPVDEAFLRKDSNRDEQSQATLGLEQKAQSTTYTVRVKTGEKKNAGTDANVFVILFGEKDDTGTVNLKASKSNKNKFEKGNIDEFTIEAVDIGALKKIRIGHDNRGGCAGWFLDWVEIDAPSLGQVLHFPCGRWLDKAEDDGYIVRDLFPADLQTKDYIPFVPYEITVSTSDIYGSGTDADVFIVLYGRNGICTHQKSLCVNKRERKICFQRGAVNKFVIEVHVCPLK
ncbi:hypothetical protein scyTo_0020217, partial [Scyliorhinus torazame]|nr:hypothetical protein [Scyliorhinus torazame]